MYQLERIVLCNWGRLAPQDVAIRGMTAILGPTGAGKSTIVDAIQLIVTGSNSRYYNLNKSTGGRDSRSIRDYCLGADDHVDPDAPARDSSDSLLAMSFRDRVSGKPISIGLIYSADRAEAHAEARRRMQVWAQYQIRHNLQLFTSAHAERRRLVLEIERLEAQRLAAAERLAAEVHAKRHHEQAILQLEQDILRTRTLLADAPIAAQVRGLESEARRRT